MRQIKAVNIKIESLPTPAKTKEAVPFSKKEFLSQLEKFVGKEKKTKESSDSVDKVSDEEEEKLDEAFGAMFAVNLGELAQVDYKASGTKEEPPLVEELGSTVNSEVVLGDTDLFEHLPTEEIQDTDLLNLFSEETSEVTVSTEVLLEAFDAADEGVIQEVLETIEPTVLEGMTQGEVKEYLLDHLTTILEEESTVEQETQEVSETPFVDELIADEAPTLINREPLRQGVDQAQSTTREMMEAVLNEQTSMTEEVVEELAETLDLSTEQVEELVQGEQVSEELSADQLSQMEQSFELMNRVTVAKETPSVRQVVTQDELVSTIETLVIEETAATSTTDKVTTARIQLSPERLGKVDLQIELSNKELTARLIVEQEETKGWIDQQVAQLKEKLLTQEITIKDFQVVVNEETLNDTFMGSEDNPFFKQKEKDSQQRKQQTISNKGPGMDQPIQREPRSYSGRSGISILV